MESILSRLIQTLAPPLATRATKEFTLLWNRKGNMLILQNDLEMIKAVLSDAEEMEHTEEKGKKEQVKTFLRMLGEVAYDAIDMFDEVNMKVALHPELEGEADEGVIRHFVRLVSACFLSCFRDTPNPILFDHEMGSRIKDIMARLNELNKRTKLMGLVSRPNQSVVSSNPRETSSFPDEDQPVLGRDRQKQQLIEMLCASDDGCVPTLLSVVGMGGLGKTTIAQAVYNDDEIKGHFSVRKWVFVGVKFDVQRIVKQLLSDASKQKIGSDPTLQDLHTCLISEIKGQKFFIVLDDAWNEKPEEWEPLWRPLKCGAKGSKVLITTRTEAVARVKDPSSPIITLEGLSNDVCWSIFEKNAFVGGSSKGHPKELKDIGEKIVPKLKGIPLAAKLIGKALIGKFRETEWRRMMDSKIWSDKLEKVGVLPSLLLSYQALPSRLKPCFQFCSLFPKDHEFDRKTLVWMWMTHDYIKPMGSERVEDAGSRYFDELLHRSFFQYINDSYVMHDLIHDLAQFVSDGQCLRVEDKTRLGSEQFNKIHHLSLFCEYHDPLEPKDLHQFNRTRTLLDIGHNLTDKYDPILCQLLGRLRCIRVLSLFADVGIKSLPECISNLKHLRYLDLRRTQVKELPESLCTLYNLQTLMLPKGEGILPPKGMSKLVNLRNLRADEDYFSKIAGIGKLKCLQKLKWPFKVSKEKNKGRNIGDLKGMNQLGGTLIIENLENVSNVEVAEEFRPLKDKVFLDRLELHWRRVRENEHSDSSEDAVIEALQPPQQLKEMKLFRYPGSQPPSWMTRDPTLLSNLVALELYLCENYTCVPAALGRLPCLKSLELFGMSGIKQVGPEFHCCGSGGDVVAFPSLQHLIFQSMDGLERWVVDGSGGVVEGGEIEDCNRELGRGDERRRCPPCRKHPLRCDSFLPHLRRLHFRSCPKLATISGLLNLNSLEQVYIRNCEELVQLRGDGEEGGKGKLTLHNGPPKMNMLQALDIWRCPKLTWSEVQPLFLLLTPSRALRICLDADYQSNDNFDGVLNRETSLEKETALEFVGTNKRELLSWLLQPKRNPLKSLHYLHVINCDELTSFTEEEEQEFCGRNLPSLLELTFKRCPYLGSLPAGLGLISSLTYLCIEDCPQILALPERGLPPTLCRIVIRGCSALHSLAVPPLLKTLHITRCPQLEEVTWEEMQSDDLIGSSNSLPSSSSSSSSSTMTLAKLQEVETDNGRLLSWLLRQPRRLEFLQKLEINKCEELKTFTDEEEEGWRRNLRSLRRLDINRCPNLRSLPVLPSLESLFIRDCALLEGVMWLEEEKEGPHQHRSLLINVNNCPNLCSLPEGLKLNIRDRFFSGSPWITYRSESFLG